LTLLALEANLDGRLSADVHDAERPMLHIFLDICFVHLTTDETLSVENGVGRVRVECILCGVANQSLVVCETDP